MNNVAFLHPIIFPKGTDEVKTQLNLSTPSASVSHTSWAQFRFFVVEENVECCSGFLRVFEHKLDRGEFPTVVPFTSGAAIHDWIQNISDACQGPEHDPYVKSTEMGVKYGPCFHVLEHVKYGDGGEAIAEVSADSWKRRDTSQFAQDLWCTRRR